jgi:hypothetical protein
MEIEYLALDPGNSTGWATFGADGNPIGFGTLKGKDEFYEFLKSQPESLVAVICEDFRLYPWKSMQQAWSQLDTVRLIGVVEFWCSERNKMLVFQNPSIKTIAYAWAGIPVPKNKALTHETDAYVHGVYYLQSIGVRTPQQGNPDRATR